jgi:hypothetical protein
MSPELKARKQTTPNSIDEKKASLLLRDTSPVALSY